MTQRHITTVRPSQPSTDGDGVAIQRIALMGDIQTDPVLLIDELRSPYRKDFAGGFPPHPHRGMQTLTYLKDGGIIHEDSMGNRGEISGGGAQWMSAGSGVIHSEMPTLDTQGLHGFQLWFNLPAAEKMLAPRYRDIPSEGLSRLEGVGFAGIAVSGTWNINDVSVTGPLDELVPQASLLDISIEADSEINLATTEGHTAIGFLYDGSVAIEGEVIPRGHLLVTSDGDQWRIKAGDAGAHLLIMTGKPIGEPVVGYGPFVMNTREEIEQAIRDYQSGQFIKSA